MRPDWPLLGKRLGQWLLGMLVTQYVWSAGEAVIATSHPLAAEAGAWALERGGDAVDAAAAIQFALDVVEPQSSGIGGGAFFLVYRAATHQVYALDAREVAPRADTPDQFSRLNYLEASTSGIAVGVPGTLAGVEALRRRWGHLTLAQSLQPAIDYARKGIVITPYLAHSLQSSRAALQPEARALTRDAQGQVRSLGQRWVQPELAHSLSLIARMGPKVFYEGEIARAMVVAQRRTRAGPAGQGRMSLEDLAHYRPVWRAPLEGEYRGYRIVTMPPPSSGGVAVLQALQTLAPFRLGTLPGLGAGDPDEIHLTIEALRLAMADRARWLGDPAATPIPLGHLLSPPYLAQQSRRLERRKRMEDVLPGTWPEGTNTTQFTVVDHEGNVVSVTSTVEAPWGSGILVPGYGFFLNSELTDFNLKPQAGPGDPGANDVRPQRRPRSSMAPTLVFKGDQWVSAYGSPGGVSIISTVLETTQDLLDDALTPEAALSLPRYAVMDAQGHTLVEKSLAPAVLDQLRARGHEVTVSEIPLGSVQWVGENPQTHERQGAADPRRDGTVIRLLP